MIAGSRCKMQSKHICVYAEYTKVVKTQFNC